ncbi:2Fe-2S iron-sulfur cluster-binding protein [Methylomagnum sp.]
MPAIRYADERFELGEDESVLDGLTGHGVPVPSSCRSGVCQTCLMQATDGQPPEAAQQGLKDSLKLQNYFLACVCHPTEDLDVALPNAPKAGLTATVKALELLSGDIMRVALESHAPIQYRPGQFINLLRDQSLGRYYSIASVPQLDEHIHLHVRRLPAGRVSGWIHDDLRAGTTVELRGPVGDCFYVPGQSDQPMLLIGTGSGLAPLYGIVRDALHRGHIGPIRLFHGSRDRRGIYLADELRALTGEYPNFDYAPCLSGPEAPSGFWAGRVHEVALREVPNLKNWRLFLCGHPDMVQQAKKKAFLAGAAMKDIHSDAFHINPPAAPRTELACPPRLGPWQSDSRNGCAAWRSGRRNPRRSVRGKS